MDFSQQLLALGQDHSGLLREHAEVLESQREMLAHLGTLEDLKADYLRLGQEKESIEEPYNRILKEQRQEHSNILLQSDERYLRLNEDMKMMTGEIISLQQ